MRVYSFTSIIAMIKEICGVPEESAMACFIVQQSWSRLEQVTTTCVEEVMEFATFREDGSVIERPMMLNIRMFRAFLLYYMRKARGSQNTCNEAVVMQTKEDEFINYFGSVEYHADVAASASSAMIQKRSELKFNASGVLSNAEVI
jgi:hypothetical protein